MAGRSHASACAARRHASIKRRVSEAVSAFVFHRLPVKYAFCYCPIVKYLIASVSIGFSRQMKKPMREFRLTLTGTYLYRPAIRKVDFDATVFGRQIT
jgi:hypothetical protein